MNRRNFLTLGAAAAAGAFFPWAKVRPEPTIGTFYGVSVYTSDRIYWSEVGEPERWEPPSLYDIVGDSDIRFK